MPASARRFERHAEMLADLGPGESLLPEQHELPIVGPERRGHLLVAESETWIARGRSQHFGLPPSPTDLFAHLVDIGAAKDAHEPGATGGFVHASGADIQQSTNRRRHQVVGVEPEPGVSTVKTSRDGFEARLPESQQFRQRLLVARLGATKQIGIVAARSAG